MRIKAKPASPPTTLPTKVGVDGISPPSDPAVAAEEEDGSAPTVPVGVPSPPSGTPVSADVLDALAEDNDVDKDVETGSDDVVDRELVFVAKAELVLDWLRLFGIVSRVPEDEEGYEVEFVVDVRTTGKVVTSVEPDSVCEEVTTRS